ncbi:Crp/Fnr family transcriptional regulator [Chitinophaga sp. 30R24]|uniref:Crp/Fnr family transcriptional regulator n=1 Tax=Chitinophaga sp. 30R24 TaxID=3248838 RepID=UPI003B90FD45
MGDDFSLLEEAIGKFVTLTEEETEKLHAVAQLKTVKKGQFLLHEGVHNANTFFVNKGCLRTYMVDKSGIEHIMGFSTKGWWAGDLRPFYSNEPGNFYIQAIIDSNVIVISKEDREALYHIGVTFERFFRILAEKAFINLQDRLLDNVVLTALERYKKFIDRYPEALQVLPQKQIAAFIGVTPEFLSRAKKKDSTI